jgi:hypothetical protein
LNGEIIWIDKKNIWKRNPHDLSIGSKGEEKEKEIERERERE